MTISIEELLKPISDDNPIGVNLRYDMIYDKLRVARERDDPNLSQGVWQRDLKKADWGQVQDLCEMALTQKSKDLQICGWLVESWVGLNGLSGLNQGLDFLNEFVKAFGQNVYPLRGDDDDDMDVQLTFYEWLDKILNDHVISIDITKPKNEELYSYNFGDWKAALQFDLVTKRERNKGKADPKIGASQCTIDLFQKSLAQTDKDYLKDIKKGCDLALKKLDIYSKTLKSTYKNQTISFRETTEALNEITRLIQSKGMVDEVESKVEESGKNLSKQTSKEAGFVLNDRNDAYQLIGEIGKFLNKLEPHSPTPYLLERISSWNTKNLNEIFESITTQPAEFPVLLKFLGMDQKK